MAEDNHANRASAFTRPTLLAAVMQEHFAAVHWLDWGIWRRRGLSSFLQVPLRITTGLLPRRGTAAYIGWGLKRSGRRARALATKHRRACWLLEDGFLRSLAAGNAPSWSLIVDDEGIYYDASTPSRLERLIQRPIDDQNHARVTRLINLWRHELLSKYNAGRDPSPATMPMRYVLVVDQTAGDAAIAAGNASAESFHAMLADALATHPDCKIVLKLHPEVISGRKLGHFDIATLKNHPRVCLVADDSHPALWLANAVAVYTVTSQLGFEALLWSRPVHVYGMPFYAGWGLTHDLLPRPVRRNLVTLEQLVYAALIAYPRYIDPETGNACEPETLMRWLGLQRRQRQRFAPKLLAYGFSKWKQKFVSEFLAGSTSIFTDNIPCHKPGSIPLATWGHKYASELSKKGHHESVLRIEDGFLRSVGLGAELIRPVSWVIDPAGIYYDATRPSRLEEILLTHKFDEELCLRASSLRETLRVAGITKYNLSRSARWQRPLTATHVVLVVGQVETDASITYGANHIRKNIQLLKAVRQVRPNEYLLYKPHPDVLAGLRNIGEGEGEALNWCNEVIGDVPFETLLDQVDEVHVLTSLAGFEALLRQVPVSTWGQPFYAGWGLTSDHDLMASTANRRHRRLTLDELVAGALILYPSYISRVTHHYCTPERAVQELLEWREERASTPLFRRLIARMCRKP